MVSRLKNELSARSRYEAAEQRLAKKVEEGLLTEESLTYEAAKLCLKTRASRATTKVDTFNMRDKVEREVTEALTFTFGDRPELQTDIAQGMTIARMVLGERVD